MSSIPRDPAFDSTLALLTEGYDFMAKRRRQLESDVFATRILLQDVVCMVGPEAARLFYEDERVTRRGAMPITTLTLLQDFGSVQMLDGAAHHCRKEMFMSLMSRPASSGWSSSPPIAGASASASGKGASE
jgi:fatty-acid peroxygenase